MLKLDSTVAHLINVKKIKLKKKHKIKINVLINFKIGKIEILDKNQIETFF